MKKEKKPDYVVFDEETQSYNSKILPYSSSLSAPKITPPDVTSWKNSHIVSANNQFRAKYESIQKEYERMMQSYEYNDLVYGSKFNFEPIVGKTYHLYKAKDEHTFLSLIAPKECNFNYLGSFTLGPDKIWEKL